jgi:hypothetical protein
MNTHIVLKTLPGPNGQKISAGTEVDASEWRNAPLLVTQRYLKPLDTVADPDGQTRMPASFAQQVIEIVKQDILDRGELYELLALRFEPPAEVTLPTKGRRANQS